jgi:3',5'-nucleoside bisphosphate phosphatase
MKSYLADLHVHTVLSPCADIEMIPPLIVEEALKQKLNIIAITDHNSSANIQSVQKAALGTDLVVLPGMELQTREEVHVLCLFASLEQVNAWQQIVNAGLPPIENKPDYFGEQFIVDSVGDFIRRESQLLITSTSLTFEDACQKVHSLGGLFIPAHIDRPAFGLLANLGMVPSEVPIDALELSRHVQIDQILRKYPQIASYTLIQDGDVHRLTEFMGVNEFQLLTPNLAEIRLSLQKTGGRSIRILSQPY